MKVGNMSQILETLKPFEDIVDSQLSGITSMVSEHASKLKDIQTSQENIEIRFTNSEANIKEMFEDIKQDLAITRHKLAVNFDEKIKNVEKRLMAKFEDILEAKLAQILDEKLGSIIDARLGTK
jgi:hypothetical protein